MRILAAILLTIFLVHCEKGSPVVRDGDIISLHIAPSTITNYGDSAVLTVYVTHSDGRPVLDGTRVLLQSTGGTIAPEVETVDGRAETPFTSDAGTGTFTITAQSGQIGLETEISTQVTVVDRSVEIGNFILNVNPSNISHAGGSIQVNAIIQDPGGYPLTGTGVVFSSNYGVLASGGTPRHTDSAGRAGDTLILDRIPASVSSITVVAQVAGQTAEKNISVTTNQNPTPQITFSPSNPTKGEAVYFDASLSTDPDGDLVGFVWNFGDGITASGKTAQHAFQMERDYQVTLTVEDDEGATAATSTVVTIGTNQVPVADFSISPDSPRVGDLVTFNATLSNDPDGTITDYQWTMGNGVNRTGSTVTYSYVSARTYQVTLTVIDNGGSQASTSKSLTIVGNEAPNAAFTFSPGNPKIGDRIVFDASTSTDSDSGIKQYSWTLGDGIWDEGVVIEHQYGNPGSYVVTLTVTDNEYGKGYSSQVVNVGDNVLPTASFTITPSNPKVGDFVTFDGSSSSDPDGDIVNYDWTFGDGADGNGPVVQHRYQASKDFAVTLAVTDDLRGKALSTQVLTVSPGGTPSAQLLLTPESLSPPGGQVFLDASSTTDPESPLEDLNFYFRAYGPDHVAFTIPGGTSPIRLVNIDNAQDGDQILFEVEVQDPDGHSGRVVKTLLISQNQTNAAPVAAFSLQPGQLEAPGGQVVLNATSTTDDDTPFDDLSFDWSVLTAGNVQVNLQGTGPLVTADLTQGGIGDVVTFLLRVEDPTGKVSTIAHDMILVEGASNQFPSAILTSTPDANLTAGASAQIVLDARDSTDPEDSYQELTFSFSGASTNSGSIFSFATTQELGVALCDMTQAQSGDRIVLTVTVTDTGGLSDTASVILEVQ